MDVYMCIGHVLYLYQAVLSVVYSLYCWLNECQGIHLYFGFFGLTCSIWSGVAGRCLLSFSLAGLFTYSMHSYFTVCSVVVAKTLN